MLSAITYDKSLVPGHLKAAVTAAGGTEKLLIMDHVEEAGVKAEVIESIEADRVLTTVLEE